jgi:hypothetical protein
MDCSTLKCCPIDYEPFSGAYWSLSWNVGFTRFLAWVAKVTCDFKLDLRHESLKNIVFGYISYNNGLTFEQILSSSLVGCSWCLGHITNSIAPKHTVANVGGCMFILVNHGQNCNISVVYLFSPENWQMKHYNLTYFIHPTTYHN